MNTPTPVPDDAAVRERELLIVKWLRKRSAFLRSLNKFAVANACDNIADAIARGDHLKEPTP